MAATARLACDKLHGGIARRTITPRAVIAVLLYLHILQSK